MCKFLCLNVIILNVVAAVKIQVLPSPVTEIGDGPHWDVKTQSLYYTDQGGTKPSILRYDYHENRVYTARVKDRNESTSIIIPIKCKENQFAVGLGRDLVIVHWDGYSQEADVIRTVVNIQPGDLYAANAFNDAKADPHGRFFGGTIRSKLCSFDPSVPNSTFVSYTKKRGLIQWRSDVGISNGMAWNKKKRQFYYVDSCKLDIKEYDWDPKSGAIYNEKIAFDLHINGEDPGFIADGMTIDRKGLLWVVLHKASSIVAIDPSCHRIVKKITFPIHTVTAAAFGGPNLDELFVTSMGINANLKTGERESIPQPSLAGRLFKVTGLKSRGYPPNKLRCL